MHFLLRRAIFYLIAAWAAITTNFILPRLMPGGPVEAVMARHEGQLSDQAVNALHIAFGLDPNASMWSEYVEYWRNLFTGNLGLSFTYFPTPVSTVIAHALPWTLVLLGVVTLVEWILGTFAGIVVGWRRGTWVDAVLPLGAFLRGIPHFWMGLVIVTVFAVTLDWFPVSGGYSSDLLPNVSVPFVGSVLYHAVLPALAMVVGSLATHMLSMRNMMVTTLSEDYVLVAEAKGLHRRRVMLSYGARNAILPNVAGFALQLGFVVSGALLVEKVFSYPGIGYVLFQAVHNQDYPLLQGILLITTFTVLIASFLADLAFFALDPRTREA
ncbi:ABC transporter permease [Actinopolymorpha alba]|uniref:ABC transporter permease n=1 Tax=Actinopolymorpha alba TaxID=533267 RepID=UPI000370035D|nr:ABC transporter permease [Actinopolymorpha alba]